MRSFNGRKAEILRTFAGGIFCVLLCMLWEVDFNFPWYQGLGGGIALGMITNMWR